ncbi:unnamed protein product [Owenia fusiformis]|uniref:Inosine/uridine-preferring nucleoside hydrolase domain-containing protein n=1 Tax=Owenia fusiformis TaxID=6347 RepID=A0A8S4P4T1_OWEFU|nr:unnamed protein product [Owenia fusiformis]
MAIDRPSTFTSNVKIKTAPPLEKSVLRACSLMIKMGVRFANQLSGMLRRHLRKAPRHTKQMAYFTLMRPRLEYAAAVSGLHQQLAKMFKTKQHFIAIPPEYLHPLQRRSRTTNSVDRADMKRKVIIDTDPGTDDARAIIMALAQPDWEILAITLVAGNCKIKHQVDNIARLLHICERTEIPVYKGSECSLLGNHDLQTGYHGVDGFGDVFTYDVDKSMVKEENAAIAINDLVQKYPGEVTLITIGPLTNVAMAIRLNPSLGSQLKDCFMMGGNIHGRGNRTTSAEFNFACDPESAYIVLNELKTTSPITIAPLESCRISHLNWDVYERLNKIGSKKNNFTQQIDAYTAGERRKAGERMIVYDECAVAAAIDVSTVEDSFEAYVTIELTGQYTRGQCIVDYDKMLEKPPNCKVIVKMNQEKFEELIFQSLK